MPARRLKEFLDDRHVKYVTIAHSRAYTAQEIAASAHVPGRELAKSIVVVLDGNFAMCVLPASNEIDFALLRAVTGAKDAHLAHEQQFKELFPDCEVGAMPPFGHLYDMPVYVAQSLTEDTEIAFNACSHTELIRMDYTDFAKLANPVVGKFSHRAVSFTYPQEERFSL